MSAQYGTPPPVGEDGQYGQVLTSGICTLADRRGVSTLELLDGFAWFTGFRSPKNMVAANIKMGNGTPAGATPTLCKMGLYRVEANGDLTLLSAAANDTSLFSVAGTAYTRALAAPVPLVRGQWYATGVIVNSGAAMPLLLGAVASGYGGLVASSSPKLTWHLAGQSDLPASVPAAANAGPYHIWSELTP